MGLKGLTAPSRYQRFTTGYKGGTHGATERQWYAALADKVGHEQALEDADHIINWRTGRPPDIILRNWLKEYEDEKWAVDDKIRTRVENKVDRYWKVLHQQYLRRMMKAGHKALDTLEGTGDMPQPVILKYIADGVNQGFMLHNSRRPSEEVNFPGLTINFGQKPPPRKLRQKQVDEISESVDGEFRLLPSGDTNDGSSA